MCLLFSILLLIIIIIFYFLHFFLHVLQNGFNKIISKRNVETCLLQARIPLQKSVSTPSIMGTHDILNKENINNDINSVPM